MLWWWSFRSVGLGSASGRGLAQACEIGRAFFQKRTNAFAGFFGGLRLHHELSFQLQLVSQRLRVGTAAQRLDAAHGHIGASGHLRGQRPAEVRGRMQVAGSLAEALRGEAVKAFVVRRPGATLDAEGAVWFADAVGNRVVRMAPGGEVLESRSTGEQGAFACTLGGPDGCTLFVCVAPDFYEHARRAAREAAVWTTTVSVPGAGRP